LIVPIKRFVWSPVDLFRFSAATGNSHRIHYDPGFAREQGLDGVVVHTSLHACMLWQTLAAAVDEHPIVRFAWRNHAPLVAGREVLVRGEAELTDEGWWVMLTESASDDGTVICTGTALVGPGGDGVRGTGPAS